MTKSVFFGIFLLLWLCKTGHANLCLRQLQGWRGTLYYPDVAPSETVNDHFYTTGENIENNCIFYMETHASRETTLKFIKIKLGKAQLKVKYLEENDGKHSWKGLSTITGNVPRPIIVKVTNKTSAKIVVPKNAGSFVMSYELIACHPLPKSAEILACTKDNYVDSHCIFKCSDGYFPTHLEEPRFHAHCEQTFLNTGAGVDSYEWISSRPEIRETCIAKTLVENSCFKDLKAGEVSTCPYSFNELLRLMEEDVEPPQQITRVVPTTTTTTTRNWAGQTKTTTTTTTRMIAGADRRSSRLLPHLQQRTLSLRPTIATPTTRALVGARRLVPPQRNTDVNRPRSVLQICRKHCRKRGHTTRFTPICGSLKKQRQKFICMQCRYSGNAPCNGITVFLG